MTPFLLTKTATAPSLSSSLRCTLVAGGGEARWQPGVELRSEPCLDLRASVRMDMAWLVRVGQRSAARFRAGLLSLGHRGRMRTSARTQTCIYCGGSMSRSAVHCLSLCPVFSQTRSRVVAALGAGHLVRAMDIAVAILRVRPGDPGYAEAMLLLRELDVACRFWSGQ